VRPTSDRVRESIFDILANLIDLNGLRVVDLFAGTGALGIEALSRGARSVTFVENDNPAVASIKANLVSTGLDGSDTTVVRRDVLDYLRMRPGPFDLVLCDPPYSFDGWAEVFGGMNAELAVLESGSEIDVPAPWMVIRHRRYGGTLVTVVRSGDDSRGGSD
jgi:16S rRNA (guanine966-N2)-methyltransferase